MSAKEIHVNDQTKVRLTIKNENDIAVDLSQISLANINFIFRKPTGTLISRTPSFEGDGSDGVLYYTFVLNELDEVGLWKVQAEMTLPQGLRHSTIHQFDVLNNL